MGKILKLSGLALTIFSLVACQAEDKAVAIKEDEAKTRLAQISKNVGKKLPNEITIVTTTFESTEYNNGFVSQFGIISETCLTVNTVAINLKQHYFSLTTETTVKTQDYGEKEERETQKHRVSKYIYFEDNQRYEVTDSYSWVQVNVPEPVIETFKIYTTKDITKKEFDSDLKESYLAYLTINKDTDCNDFFSHFKEELFYGNTPVKNVDVAKTDVIDSYSKDNKGLLYIGEEKRNLQLEDIDTSKLFDEDKENLNSIFYFGYSSFMIEDYYFTTIASFCNLFYKTASSTCYKNEYFEIRVETSKTANVIYPVLSNYTKK